MTSPSSFNVSGLLGGAAGSIDTTALVSQLVQAAALPQTNLKNQLNVEKATVAAYQAISTKMAALQTAAQALTDPTAWTATTATSSVSAVVATSTGTATAGSTTFDVLHLASGQLSTVAAAADGTVVSNPSAGIVITGADGTAHQILLTTGTASGVADAINAAQVGVRATVVTTDSGPLLQLSSTGTGSSAGFSASGFDTAPQTVVAAQNAQIGVGTVGAGGYTVSSATNTFTGVIPGVTFTVSAPASNVTVTVGKDEQSVSNKVQALVDAANAAYTEINTDTTSGAILQGSLDVTMLQQTIVSAVSHGTAAGQSLKTYGIDVDRYGKFSFDAGAFASAYAADPAGTQTAIAGSFATALNSAAASAIDPGTGTISAAITAGNNHESDLNNRIDAWNTRITDLQQTLQTKFAVMQATLAKLQSQSNYLTSMLKNATGSSSGSNSG